MSALSTLNTQAALDVLAERQRQMDVEGWTAEHDDLHMRGELAAAAASYVTNAIIRTRMVGEGYSAELIEELSAKARTPTTWPWSPSWWKPAGGTRRVLVKAAALLLAEIERIDRRAEREGGR